MKKELSEKETKKKFKEDIIAEAKKEGRWDGVRDGRGFKRGGTNVCL